jgi:hypothetical protein
MAPCAGRSLCCYYLLTTPALPLQAVPLLMSVVVLLGFFLFLFAVAGVMVFKNIYHYACVDAQGNFEHYLEDLDTVDSFGSGFRKCPEGYSVKYFRWEAGRGWGGWGAAVAGGGVGRGGAAGGLA